MCQCNIILYKVDWSEIMSIKEDRSRWSCDCTILWSQWDSSEHTAVQRLLHKKDDVMTKIIHTPITRWAWKCRRCRESAVSWRLSWPAASFSGSDTRNQPQLKTTSVNTSDCYTQASCWETLTSWHSCGCYCDIENPLSYIFKDSDFNTY